MIDETAAEIAAMRTHSSSEVAVKAAKALRELLERDHATLDEFVRDLEHNAGALRRANPSHASLETALREIEHAVDDAAPESVSEAQDTLELAIEQAIERVESGKDGAAATAAALLSDGETILTHDFSTTVMSAIERAVDGGASFQVYVTEARPRFLGRKTARQLATIDGVDATLIVDSAAGHYLAECDRVLTGMTCVVENTLYNRVGTYSIAAIASHRDVPFCVAGSSAKVIEDGFVFENDFREESEVLREPAEGFEVANPAYDATPLSLVDQLLTEEGMREPSEGGR